MARYSAFLDACVLVPIALADTLLRLAEAGLYRPLWSDRVLDEVVDAIEAIHPELASGPTRSRADAMQALVKVVESMRAGKAITVAPLDQRLTTQEAADFLGISRPTLVKLLEQGEIPYERPAAGRHRRVRLSDVLDYQILKRQERRTTLDQMTAHEAEAGLYHEVPDYSEALRTARKRPAS